MPTWEYNKGFGDNSPNYFTSKLLGAPLPMNFYHRAAWTSTHFESEGGYPRPTHWAFPVYSDDLAYNKAVNRFYDAAKRSNFSAAITIGEAPKTFELIADTALRFVKLYRGIRKGSFENIRDALGFGINQSYARRLNKIGKRGLSASSVRNQTANAADLFLEIKYGWRPLLQDIQNLTEALQLKWDEDDSDILIRGSGTAEGSGSVYNWEGTYKNRSKITAYFRVFNQGSRNIDSFGLADLGGVAWELIPFSFVVDWFVPVGDWIGAQTALTGLQWVKGCQSGSTYQVSELVDDVWGNRYNMKLDQSPYIYFQHGRGVLSGPPSTIPILKSKDFRSLFNFDKVLTSLALLNSVFRGKKSRWS
jgi:hypothetical protein